MKNKIKIIVFVMSFSLFWLFMGCDLLAKDYMDFYQGTKSMDLSGENIEGVSINSTEEDLFSAFGSPKSVEKISDPKSKYLIYDGIEFGMVDQKVIRYYFQKEYQTSKGIKIGDTKGKIIEEYGRNYYKRVESGIDTIGYFDKKNRINLEFGVKEDKVQGIIVQKIGWREEE